MVGCDEGDADLALLGCTDGMALEPVVGWKVVGDAVGEEVIAATSSSGSARRAASPTSCCGSGWNGFDSPGLPSASSALLLEKTSLNRLGAFESEAVAASFVSSLVTSSAGPISASFVSVGTSARVGLGRSRHGGRLAAAAVPGGQADGERDDEHEPEHPGQDPTRLALATRLGCLCDGRVAIAAAVYVARFLVINGKTLAEGIGGGGA